MGRRRMSGGGSRRRSSALRGRDPHWMDARFDSECGKKDCNEQIKKGDRIFFYPVTRTALGSRCGHAEEASADFEAHKMDERIITGD